MRLIVGEHRLLAVIRDRAISREDGNTIGKRNFRRSRIVIYVIDFIVADRLDLRVLCGIDRQTTLIKCLVSLSFGVTFLFYQIGNDLIGQLIYKVGVDIVTLGLDIYELDTIVNIVSHSCVVFILRDITLVEHVC